MFGINRLKECISLLQDQIDQMETEIKEEKRYRKISEKSRTATVDSFIEQVKSLAQICTKVNKKIEDCEKDTKDAVSITSSVLKEVEKLKNNYESLTHTFDEDFKTVYSTLDSHNDNIERIGTRLLNVEKFIDKDDSIILVLGQIKTQMMRKNTLLEKKLKETEDKLDQAIKSSKNYESKLMLYMNDVEKAKEKYNVTDINRRMQQLEINLTKLNDYINYKIKD